MNIKSSYTFPAVVIKIYSDGSCREFLNFCPMVSTERSRNYVAKALLALRKFNKNKLK